MLTGKRDTVSTLVAVVAVPLSPVSTLLAYFTVPTVAFLRHIVPAEGEPIGLAAALALVAFEKLFERNGFVPAGEFVFCRQLLFGETFVNFDVLDGTDG
jgi:hypothetical protein